MAFFEQIPLSLRVKPNRSDAKMDMLSAISHIVGSMEFMAILVNFNVCLNSFSVSMAILNTFGTFGSARL